MNTLKVTVLLAGLTGLFVLMGQALGGNIGMVIAFCLAVAMNVGAYWFSDKLALKAARAQEVTPQQAPDLHAMVEELSSRAEIPKPKVYLVNDPSPNAFATGRNPQHAAVAVNTGLLDLLSRDEVYGVVAHEIAHIKSRDTLTMTVVATVAGAISMLANMAQFAAIFGGFGRGDDDEGMNPIGLLVMAMIAPFIAMIMQLAVSRAREFEADKLGARLAGTPRGLSNALQKLERGTSFVPTRTDAAHAPLYIVNPLKGRGGLMKLFMTHPPVEERVAKLEAMSF
ncbi:MAG: zinc metalloprotease HtpX [Fimbriimonadaceae bacterium]